MVLALAVLTCFTISSIGTCEAAFATAGYHLIAYTLFSNMPLP
jgi:hypothetical protein